MINKTDNFSAQNFLFYLVKLKFFIKLVLGQWKTFVVEFEPVQELDFIMNVKRTVDAFDIDIWKRIITIAVNIN